MDIRDMKRLKMAYQNGNLMATIDSRNVSILSKDKTPNGSLKKIKEK